MAQVVLAFAILLTFQEMCLGDQGLHRCHWNESGIYVRASDCYYPVIKSCNSALLSGGKEVHIIHLSSPGSPTARIVKVHLQKLDDDYDVTQNSLPVILVLSSNVSLAWQLVLDDAIKWDPEIWISQNTKLVRSKEMNVTKFGSQANIIKWTMKKFAAVTSYLNAPDTINTVDLYAEIGHRNNCHPVQLSTQKIAYRKKEVSVSGCFVPTMGGSKKVFKRDVHIIEFHSLPISESVRNISGKPVVTLNIIPREIHRSVRAVQADIVIKSALDIVFEVGMELFGGKVNVHIHTDRSVNSGGHGITRRQSLAVSAEKFDHMTSRDLFNWTVIHLGMPLSFSKIYRANYIEVLIDRGGHLSRSSHFMNAPPSIEISDQSSYNILELARDLHVECREESFTVVIKPQDLLLCKRLTLSDEGCRARSNSTHCILEAKYGECLSCLGMDGNQKSGEECYARRVEEKFKNEILLHNTTIKSEVGDSPRLHSIKLDCFFSSDATINHDMKANKGNAHYQLLVYADKSKKEEALKLSQVENDGKLFIEALVPDDDDDDDVIPIVQDCRVEAAVEEKWDVVHQLVRGRCPVEPASWWRYPSRSKPFSPILAFTVEDVIISNNSLTAKRFGTDYLRISCYIAPCYFGRSAVASGVRECIEEDYHACEKPLNPFLLPPFPSPPPSDRAIISITSLPFSYSGTSIDQSNLIDDTSRDADDDNDVEKKVLLRTGRLGGTKANAQQQQPCNEDPTHLGEYVSMEIGIMVSFSAFLIGILSMSALWLIYVKTRPKKLIGSKHLRSPDTSGESTPSSTSSITICQIKRTK